PGAHVRPPAGDRDLGAGGAGERPALACAVRRRIDSGVQPRADRADRVRAGSFGHVRGGPRGNDIAARGGACADAVTISNSPGSCTRRSFLVFLARPPQEAPALTAESRPASLVA